MVMERKKEFQRNPHLENLLKELNNLFAPLEKKTTKGWEKPACPLVLIQGVARSGTTPLLQWLASLGNFAYPSNLLSRFYGAPYIGGKIQQLLFDPRFNFNDELFDFSRKTDFFSSLGKTRGLLAPNEFWYFWRRFFSFGEIQYLDKSQQKKVNIKAFLAELAALESVFEKPFVMKGLIVNWNIPFVSDMFDKILFIYIKRHPVYNIQSLLQARVKFYGNEDAWYSFKPQEYDELKELPVVDQVAGQIYYTNRAIEKGLDRIDRSRWIEVGYEDFCSNPGHLFAKIVEKFSLQGYKTKWRYSGRKGFDPMNRIKFSQKKIARIISAYQKFSGNEISI